MRAASPEIFSMDSDQLLHISRSSSGGLGGFGIKYLLTSYGNENVIIQMVLIKSVMSAALDEHFI
jgi:hypothetical protein